MKITRRKRSKQSYTKPSVSLIELESVPLLAKSNDGDSGGAKGVEPLGGGITDGNMDSNLDFAGDTLGY